MKRIYKYLILATIIVSCSLEEPVTIFFTNDDYTSIRKVECDYLEEIFTCRKIELKGQAFKEYEPILSLFKTHRDSVDIYDADITDKIVYENEEYCGNRFLMKEILDSTSSDGRLIRSYFDFVQSNISDSEYLHSVPYE